MVFGLKEVVGMHQRYSAGPVSEHLSFFLYLPLYAEVVVFLLFTLVVLNVGVQLGVNLRPADVSDFTGTDHALHDKLSDAGLRLYLAFI